jgi:hypothetical protein
MLMYSQQQYAMWTFAALKGWFWERHKCRNNCPWTLIVQERVCQVGPKEVNVWPEGAVWCYVCQTSGLVWTGGKHIPRVNSDLWQDMSALLDSSVKAVQHGMVSKGISTTQKIQDTAVSWQDHGRCVLGFRRNFFHMVKQLKHSITYSNFLHFTMMCTKQFGRKDLGNCQRSSSYWMTTLIHVWQMW